MSARAVQVKLDGQVAAVVSLPRTGVVEIVDEQEPWGHCTAEEFNLARLDGEWGLLRRDGDFVTLSLLLSAHAAVTEHALAEQVPA